MRGERCVKVGKARAVWLCGLVLGSGQARGQEQRPAELPPVAQTAPAQGGAGTSVPPETAQSGAQTLRVNTNLVLVPTLVEAANGEVVYGLGADAFTLTDNGVSQKVHVDDDLDTTPVSLVVCLEKGRASGLQFEKFVRLGPLLSLFLGNGNGEVTLVEFDSQLEFREAWTGNTDLIQEDLNGLRPGDGGAALLDAAGYSIDLLEQRPPERRRILLLLSESRDHGSKRVSAPELVERIGTSNTLVLSLTWSPAKAEFLDQLVNPGNGSLLSLAVLAANALKANAAKSLAVMSGGEALSFTSERAFEERVSELASHSRNRYLLSFHPAELTPGLHRLEVKLKDGVPGRVVARTDYWARLPEQAEGEKH